MQRHRDRVIDGKVLRHADVEAGRNRRGTHMRRQRGVRWHDVIRHVARLVVRRLEAAVDADGKDRQIVEEERVEVISVEHQDQVGPRRRQLVLLRREQFCSLGIGPIALDEMRKDRSVRHAEAGDDLRHFFVPPLA